MNSPLHKTLTSADNIRLNVTAHQSTSPEKPAILFCSGYTSDTTGTKATRILDFAQKTNTTAILFDYRAHGQSQGSMETATIGDWINDTITVFDDAQKNIAPQAPWIIAGSSMGGWIALHILKRYSQNIGGNIAGVMLIAPAPDFPEKLLLPDFPPIEQKKIQQGEIGKWCDPDKTPEQGYILSQTFLEESRKHHLLDKPKTTIPCPVPIRMLAGMKDDIVPFAHMMETLQLLDSPDALALVDPQGDHMLSDENNLVRIEHTLSELIDLHTQKP